MRNTIRLLVFLLGMALLLGCCVAANAVRRRLQGRVEIGRFCSHVSPAGKIGRYNYARPLFSKDVSRRMRIALSFRI